MTKKLKLIGAALLALAILPAAALLFNLHVSPAVLVSLGMGMVGVVTVTYESFQTGQYGGGYAGGATAPTQAQAAQMNSVQALVNFTDTDTTFTLTHNFNLSTAQVAALLPLVTMNIVSSVQAIAVAVAPVVAVAVGANTVTFTKLQATGSGLTIAVAIRKPSGFGF